MTTLAVDIGTTCMKAGVFANHDGAVRSLAETSADYEMDRCADSAFAQIDPDKWTAALVDCCAGLAAHLGDVETITLSGTTPGLTAMAADGTATHPAILMLDQRSIEEAAAIRRTVGEPALLAETANLPVAGGSSLAGILWLRNHREAACTRTACFGHSNTYMARWLTGDGFFIDPSSASLTNLYRTTENDLKWSRKTLERFDLSEAQLPDIVPAHRRIGRVCDATAIKLGLPNRPKVLIGGNDAVLAAYSADVETPGQVINVNGTCEITMVCTDRCFPSAGYNVRAHVIPGRWFTFFVLNAGGKALEWFHSVFCSEMSERAFFEDFAPDVIATVTAPDEKTRYIPYLAGSRYSTEEQRGAFEGLHTSTDRRELFAVMIRDICRYHREHLDTVGREIDLQTPVILAGGKLADLLRPAKQRWFDQNPFEHRTQSSLLGAAKLALEEDVS
jgi:sugar (pentulose or hexulose) kinase